MLEYSIVNVLENLGFYVTAKVEHYSLFAPPYQQALRQSSTLSRPDINSFSFFVFGIAQSLDTGVVFLIPIVRIRRS
jgi:hypothetical protein